LLELSPLSSHVERGEGDVKNTYRLAIHAYAGSMIRCDIQVGCCVSLHPLGGAQDNIPISCW